MALTNLEAARIAAHSYVQAQLGGCDDQPAQEMAWRAVRLAESVVEDVLPVSDVDAPSSDTHAQWRQAQWRQATMRGPLYELVASPDGQKWAPVDDGVFVAGRWLAEYDHPGDAMIEMLRELLMPGGQRLAAIAAGAVIYPRIEGPQITQAQICDWHYALVPVRSATQVGVLFGGGK